MSDLPESSESDVEPPAPEPTADETPVLEPPPKAPFVVPAPLIFLLALLFAVTSFGGPMLLAGRGSVSSAEIAPEKTLSVATAAVARTPTPAPTPVRVLSATASAEMAGSPSLYRVTFVWTLDGAREGDTALLRFSIGSRVVSEQRGALEAPVYAAGKLTLATQQECSAEGWSATLVSIRGVAPQGEATARAAGVTCP